VGGVGGRKGAEVNVVLLKPFQVRWVGSPRAASIVVPDELPAGEAWK